jgi:hypothetical protein
MTDGQGNDRRLMATETPATSARPAPQPGRPSASHLRAGCPPAPGPGRQSRLCLWPHLWLRTPSATRAFAMRPGCTSPRLARRSGRPRSRGPCRCTSNGSVVCMSARPQGPLRPYGTKKSAAMELTRWPSTEIAMRIATARPDVTASVRVPDCRRQEGPTVGRPCRLSPSRRSPPMPTSLA